MIIVLVVFICGLIHSSHPLDNGLALTPPMGWLSWLRFGCNTDCEKHPNECISENLIKRTARVMGGEGYVEAGYEYVIIDDCWLEKKRGPDGRLVADKKRFPSGIKALSQYLHSMGLKFGIYEDYGNYTCEGYPGVLGHEALDAATFAEWEVDYVKLDGCGAPDPDKGTISGNSKRGSADGESRQLERTARSVPRAPQGPPQTGPYKADVQPGLRGKRNEAPRPRPRAGEGIGGFLPNYSAIAKTCNIWRNYRDIQNSWESLLSTILWFGDHQDEFAEFAGPGNFNDPDMLAIGNSGLTEDQAKVQFAIWCIMAAPLIMSTDLSTIKPEFRAILLDKYPISVNQDVLGKQGRRISISDDKKQMVYKKEIAGDAYVLLFVNLHSNAVESSFTHEQMELPVQDYIVEELYREEPYRLLSVNDVFKVQINATGKQAEAKLEAHEDTKLRSTTLNTCVVVGGTGAKGRITRHAPYYSLALCSRHRDERRP
ncbi:unnamed protein product [Spodoptera exigua]|nr:unnamed protein product [Spodoptera exigua]